MVANQETPLNSAESVYQLPRSTPESQGVASAAISGFFDAVAAGGFELHSFMLARHGHIVAEAWWEPYRAELPHVLYSLSKSFASTAAGLAIAEGKLSLDDTVLSFFPDDAPAEASGNLRAMCVRHLLSMSTGNAQDTTGSLSSLGGDNWVKGFLACPVEHAPGTHFVYNSGATYMVSAIVQKVTGEGLLDYLTPRLLRPLGIHGATWETCPRGIALGGWGMKVKTEDIARFGQLYLQRGMWNGTRLLSEAWVEEATSFQVSNGDNPDSDWAQGYGFQFWRCRHGGYRGDGAFGQYCVVLPDQDAVLAITSGLKDMQAVLNLVWEHLLPAFGGAQALFDPAAADALQTRAANLKVATPAGEATSHLAAEISGKTYVLEPAASPSESRLQPREPGFEAIRFELTSEPPALMLRNAYGDLSVPCGLDGSWPSARIPFRNATPETVAASGAWTAPRVFTFRLCLAETPFCPTLTCRFDGNTVTIDYVPNCGFRSEPFPPIVGRFAEL